MQPTTAQISQLWQIYLSNVDPLFKILHAPTIQNSVLGRIEKSSISRNEQALFSSIYFVSVASLENDECHILLHEQRKTLLSRFKQATENALCAANVVTTDEIEVLAAFLLYLISLQSLGEVERVWSMMGLAIRLAVKLKLPKLECQSNLSIFEKEMRKRLWSAIVNFDAQTSESVGRERYISFKELDLELVPGIGDVELFSTMRKLPEHERVMPEMLYVRLLAYFNTGVRTRSAPTVAKGLWQLMGSCEVSLSEQEDMLKVFKTKISSDIIQHCDPSVPLQLLTRLTSEIFLTKATLQSLKASYGSQIHISTETEGTQACRRSFKTSLVLMETVIELFSQPALRRWRWQFQVYFPWFGLLPLTKGAMLLKLPTDDEDVKRARNVLRAVFEHVIPSLNLSQRRSALSISIRRVLGCKSTQQSDRDRLPKDIVATSVNRHMLVFKHGNGSTPHNALLPGMGCSRSEADNRAAYSSDGDSYGIGESLQTDWNELYRLMTDLCQI